ncbi:MAG: PrsW family glutamic-type intramembrane protease [Myxococcales bacterium]
MIHALARPLLGLLPALSLLAALLWLDSYKLVKLRAVLAVLACGAAIAASTYPLNEILLDRFTMPLATFSRYVAPASEELLKALVLVALIRAHRIGFLVDAAIFGFAVGAGFAMAENLYYLHLVPGASIGTWIVRGFGTALMHGGTTAIFGVMGLAMAERRPGPWVRAFLPGLAVAVLLHSAFNHFFLSPGMSTLGTVLVLPPLFYAVFRLSERSLGDWLGKGFDADTAMLELINSGRFADSPVGRYLLNLKSRFEGPLVADLLCYLRLHTELSLRAKGILLMRENGFEVPVDQATRDVFTELRFLKSSIGRTGARAMQPMLGMSHKDLWQLYMLGK